MSIPFAFAGLDTDDVGVITATSGTDYNTILAGLPGGLAAIFGVQPPNFTYGQFGVDWLQLSAEAACVVAFGVYASAAGRFFELARAHLPAGGTVPLAFDPPLVIPFSPTVQPALYMIEDSGAATAVSGHLAVGTVVKTPADEFPLDGVGLSGGLLGISLLTQGS